MCRVCGPAPTLGALQRQHAPQPVPLVHCTIFPRRHAAAVLASLSCCIASLAASFSSAATGLTQETRTNGTSRPIIQILSRCQIKPPAIGTTAITPYFGQQQAEFRLRHAGLRLLYRVNGALLHWTG